MPLYPATIFLGAFLLFQVQPLLGKYILPWFGGGAGVWSVCLLFFQIGLLLGYLYAHLICGWLRLRSQVVLHVILLLLALTFLPLGPSPETWKPFGVDAPVLHIILLLSATVGVPYVLLAATAPLVQWWWSLAYPDRSPYRLYAVSNAGALLALLTYPVLVEPGMTLGRQAGVWSWGYGLFTVLCAVCAIMAMKAASSAADPDTVSPEAERTCPDPGNAPGIRDVALWMGWTACASALLLSTTSQMCQEVAAVPFLWVAPLTLYLLTFIIAFDRPTWYSRPVFGALLVIMVPAACLGVYGGLDVVVWKQLATFSVTLFVCCMICHGELVRTRPPPRHLTLFYLAVAAGGACGGLGVTLVAPLLFPGYWEYPLALLACSLLALWAWRPGVGGASRRDNVPVAERAPAVDRKPWRLPLPLRVNVAPREPRQSRGNVARTRERAKRSEQPFRDRYYVAAWTGTVAWMALLAALVAATAVMRQGTVTETSRNFYGVLRVVKGIDAAGEKVMLRHGRTIHGLQFLDPERRRLPTAYYGDGTGLHLALSRHPRRMADALESRSLRVGVLGLGAGTSAIQGRAGDSLRFYEINPNVVRLARKHFTYLDDATVDLDIVIGDARMQLEREWDAGRPQQFDVLAVDAFTSDAIPIHLITREAVDLYLRHLKPDGVLAFHLSNRMLHLTPVAKGLAEAVDMPGLVIQTEEDRDNGTFGTAWVVLSRNQAFLRDADTLPHTTALHDLPFDGILWTDDFASLWQVLRW